MTTDFTSVVKWFFVSVYRYTENVKFLYNSVDQEQITKTQQEIKHIEDKVYDLIKVRINGGYNVPTLYKRQCYIESFSYTALDKSLTCCENQIVLDAYKKVINEICEYYSVLMPRRKRLLDALNIWLKVILKANVKLLFQKTSLLSKEKHR